MRWIVVLATLACAVMAACGGNGPAATSTATPLASATASPVVTVAPTEAPTPQPTPTATATERPEQTEPVGFPLARSLKVGLVAGDVGSRAVVFGVGVRADDYSRIGQPSDDPVEANSGGWNCRTHVEYEGQPAVDWYVPEGSPVRSTMDGTATLYAITVSNAFDYWGVDREPYLGDPDRPRAPIVPFPGPSGGKGVFVVVENDGFVTEYGHLDLGATAEVVPESAFEGGYGSDSDWESLFGAMRGYLDATAIATWAVEAGDVIGTSGDSGYSEASHLHYTVARQGSAGKLCPTLEAGFADGGWLLR